MTKPHKQLVTSRKTGILTGTKNSVCAYELIMYQQGGQIVFASVWMDGLMREGQKKKKNVIR